MSQTDVERSDWSSATAEEVVPFVHLGEEGSYRNHRRMISETPRTQKAHIPTEVSLESAAVQPQTGQGGRMFPQPSQSSARSMAGRAEEIVAASPVVLVSGPMLVAVVVVGNPQMARKKRDRSLYTASLVLPVIP